MVTLGFPGTLVVVTVLVAVVLAVDAIRDLGRDRFVAVVAATLLPFVAGVFAGVVADFTSTLALLIGVYAFFWTNRRTGDE